MPTYEWTRRFDAEWRRLRPDQRRAFLAAVGRLSRASEKASSILACESIEYRRDRVLGSSAGPRTAGRPSSTGLSTRVAIRTSSGDESGTTASSTNPKRPARGRCQESPTCGAQTAGPPPPTWPRRRRGAAPTSRITQLVERPLTAPCGERSRGDRSRSGSDGSESTSRRRSAARDRGRRRAPPSQSCLLYTSDAADE